MIAQDTPTRINPGDLTGQAFRHFQAGRIDQARRLLDRILAADRQHPKALHLAGLVAYEAGDFEAAGQHLDRVLAQQPGADGIWTHLGIALRQLEREAAAIQAHRRATVLAPASAHGWSCLASLFGRTTALRDAVRANRRALVAQPEAGEIRCQSARALERLGDYRGSLAECQRALVLQPGDSKAVAAILQSLMAPVFRPRLPRMLRRVGALPPGDIELQRAEIDALVQLGQSQAALRRLQEHAKRPGANQALSHRLAVMLLRDGRAAESLEVLQKRHHGDNARNWLVALFRALAAERKPNQEGHAATLRAAGVDDLETLRILAKVFAEAFEVEAAKAVFTRAQELGAGEFSLLRGHLELLLRADEWTATEAALQSHVARFGPVPTHDAIVQEVQISLLYRDLDNRYSAALAGTGGKIAAPGPALQQRAGSRLGDVIVGALAAAGLERQPFNHIYVEQMLPDAIYTEMTVRLAATGGIDWGGNPAYPNRGFISFHADWGGQVWADYRQALDDPAFLEAVVELLDGGVLKAQLEARGYRLKSSVNITVDRQSYSLGPHKDHITRFASALLYMPVDDSTRQLGTSLYASKDAGHRFDNGRHQPFAAFKRLKTVPFQPNSGLFFLNFGDAYHGVEPVASDLPRPMVQYTVYIEPV